MRAELLRFRFALMGAMLLAFTAQPVAAQGCTAIGDTGPTSCTPFPAGPATAAQAQDCLRYAASFANDGTVRQCVDQPGTNFEDILSPRYAFALASSRYLEHEVDAVIEWAIAQPRIASTDAVLMEAALRQASAHGMFADLQFVLGLNAASYGALAGALGDPVLEAVSRLDSRVCRTPGNLTPLSAAFRPPTCHTDTDCQTPNECLPTRFEVADGVYGAIQEYRRGEQALLRVARALGADRFVELDGDSAPSCGGTGCAARLLLRLGALRSQAQAELAETYWQDAVARGANAATGATCAAPFGGATCQADVDCDSSAGSGDGRCGADPGERALVRLRQFSDGVLDEGAAAQAVYGRLGPDLAAADASQSDYALVVSSLARIEDISARSTTSVTPFGVPSDYVPFLSGGQRDFLQCTDQVSTFRCLLPLLTNEYFGALPALDLSQAQAQAELVQYVDSARDEANQATSARTQLIDVMTRLLGSQCTGTCTCTPSQEEAGECVSLFGGTNVWEIQGAVCDDPDTLATACTRTSADGELERQIQAVRTVSLSLQSQIEQYGFLIRLRNETAENLADIQAIRDASCGEVQAVLDDAQNQVSDAIKDRAERLGDFLPGPIDKAAKFGRWISAVKTGDVLGAISAGKILFGVKKKNEERREDLGLQARLAEIETGQQKQLNAIQCRESGAIAQIQGDEALLRIEGEIRSVFAQAQIAKSQLAEAEAAANQLLVELARAFQRYREGLEFERIWADASPFKNPQNYRVLALDAALTRSGELRRAQELTWYLLRAAAYDLAQPDVAIPARGLTGDTVARVPAGECNEYLCSGPGIADADCTATGNFFLGAAGETTPSDGSCSLRAVFAARNAADLKSVLRSAFVKLAETNRELACNSGVCEKTIKLRELYTDPLQAARPTLGEVMVARGIEADGAGIADFGILLDRAHSQCISRIDTQSNPPTVDWDCNPSGATGLTPDSENAFVGGQFFLVGSGPADASAASVWNQRILQIEGQIAYAPGIDPRATMCRDGNGRPVAPIGFTPQEACTLFGAQPCTTSPPVGAGGACFALVGGGNNPFIELQQLAPGEVRTKEAQTPGRDSIVTYRVRQGNLGATAFSRFNTQIQLSDLAPVADIGAQGIPVASPRWRLRVDTVNGVAVLPAFTRAYLESIEDITLKILYSAYELP